MGIFRFLLAMCVIAGHSSPILGHPILNAGLAVKAFFLISGFYMELIMDTKYGKIPNGRYLFYTNRALRIYPMYFLTLIFSVAIYAAASIKLGRPVDRLQYWVDAWNLQEYWQLALIALSQFTVVGLDMTPMFSFSSTYGFSWLDLNGPGAPFKAWRFNFAPHCWSIGAELLFYAFVPLLHQIRTRPLFIASFISFALILFVRAWFPSDLTSETIYHLGILQFPYFILGILAYRCLFKKHTASTWGKWRYPFIVAVMALTFTSWPILYTWSGMLYLALAFISIPLLFDLTKNLTWDRWIGELSYPMYLLHIPLKWILLALSGVSTRDESTVSGLSLAIVTIAAAAIMVFCVDRPLEKLRRARLPKKI